ncbi:MAG: OB-fold nucleic acid binding domain-containing protein, partial [Oscillospiraceae bacterium]
MKRTKISALYADASAFTGAEITVCGWVRTVRDMKNFAFVELNDGSALKSLQVVFEKENLPNFDEIAHQNVGAALVIKGLLALTPEAKQPFELKASEIVVEGVSAPEYPLQKKR